MMSHLLSIITFLPLVGVAAILLTRGSDSTVASNARWIALVTTLVEFVLAMKAGQGGAPAARGLENPERMAAWARQNLERFRSLGERLGTGPLDQIEGFGPQRHVVLARQADTEFCVGWKPSMVPDQVREMMRKVLALWAS